MIEHDLTQHGRRVRAVLVGMITSSHVLSRVAGRWTDRGLFPEADRASNVVGGLCVKFYREFRKAPAAEIGPLFEEWAAERPHERELLEMVRLRLESLSGDYERMGEEVNVDHTNKVAGRLFRRERIKQLVREATRLEEAGRVDDAEALIVGYRRVDLGGSAAVNSFNDKAEIYAAFEQDVEPIVKYNVAAVDRFLGRAMERGGFVSFLAPNKVGKSYYLMDLVYRSLACRRKTAFFLVGDMSKGQFHRRLYSRAACRPIWSKTGWPLTVRFPERVSLPTPSKGGLFWFAETGFREEVFKRPLDGRRADEGCDRLLAEVVKSEDIYFKLSPHSGRGISALGIRSELESMESEGFVPDVVIVDYADNLAPVSARLENRDAINETWLHLRAIALERNCLVVTATQSDADGFGRWVLTRENFSDDRRKLDHVTAMIGLNRLDKDVEQQIVRMNMINMRDGDFDPNHCCYTAGCLAVGNPIMKAVFPWGSTAEAEKEEEVA